MSRSSLHPGREGILIVFFLGLLFALDVYAMYSILTSRYPGANDFYSRWKGAELFWREGLDPYSDETTLAIQEGIYGRAAQPDEDPGPFAYPFYTVFFLAPLALLPYAWAEAIWLVLLQFALIGGVLLGLAIVDWQLPRWLVALTCFWAVAFYPSARTILLGQFAGLVFLWAAGAVWALRARHDILAGVLLALTTIKPQMSILLIPALLIWGGIHRRWHFVGAFGAMMALLLGASFLMLPAWLGEFVTQVLRYPSYTAIGSPVWILAHQYLPSLGSRGEAVISILLLLYLLIQWRHLPHAESTSALFLWLVGLTLIVTNLVVLRTATTNYVVMYIALFIILKVATEGQPRSHLWLALFYVSSIVGMWALFLATVAERFEHPIVYLPLPIGLFIAFVWAREEFQKADIRWHPQRD